MWFFSDNTSKESASPLERDSLGVEVRSVAAREESDVGVFMLSEVADGALDDGGKC